MKGFRISLLFAYRYLFSKKSVNAINIISLISFIGVLVSSAALVIVLSFYNGIEKFILSMYSNFTPELLIEPTEGKTFDPNNSIFQTLKANPEVKNYIETLEDKILVQYDNLQFVARLKGLENEKLTKLDEKDILEYGTFSLSKDSISHALIGSQVQANLRIPINDFFNNVELYYPRKGSSVNNLNPLEDFNIRKIGVNGVLAYQPEFDDLIMVPIEFARNILAVDNNISAIEIYLNDKNKTSEIQKNLEKELQNNFSIKNREQQNPTLYKTIKSEKWIVFFILTFIGVIAIFNIIGSLTMLVIDKKEDMKILQYLGAKRVTIERIFLIEGMLISTLGSIMGILFGFTFCYLQSVYGFIRTGANSGSLIDVYPVDMRLLDFALVFLTIFAVSLVISFFSSKLSVREIGKNITEKK